MSFHGASLHIIYNLSQLPACSSGRFPKLNHTSINTNPGYINDLAQMHHSEVS
jgi:hypothetical protein